MRSEMSTPSCRRSIHHSQQEMEQSTWLEPSTGKHGLDANNLYLILHIKLRFHDCIGFLNCNNTVRGYELINTWYKFKELYIDKFKRTMNII